MELAAHQVCLVLGIELDETLDLCSELGVDPHSISGGDLVRMGRVLDADFDDEDDLDEDDE